MENDLFIDALSNIAMDNAPFIDDFPIWTTIIGKFPMAVFVYRRYIIDKR